MAVAETFIPRSSSNIAEVSYDPETSEMTVEFQNGSRYSHKNVDHDVFRRFQTAPSAGQFYHRAVKGAYDYEQL